MFMLHNKTPNWSGLRKDASDPVQIRYNHYIPDAQKAKNATEKEQSFGANYCEYDSESDFYSGSDSAASVYSLLGVSPQPSLITESMIPWDDFVTEIKDFESWLQETLSS